MLFFYITRFNLRKDKTRQLKQFFTIYKIKTIREEKNKYLKNLKINIISNIKSIRRYLLI
jgi:hypothetical protein